MFWKYQLIREALDHQQEIHCRMILVDQPVLTAPAFRESKLTMPARSVHSD